MYSVGTLCPILSEAVGLPLWRRHYWGNYEFPSVRTDRRMASMETNGKRSPVILLVDDDPVIISLLSSYLQRKGHLVASAANGAEALRIFEQSPESVGVLVSDVDMPGLSGVELAERLEARNCPVMLISGKPFPSEARERGWTLLSKPFLPSALLETAEHVMSETTRHEKA